MDYDGQKWAELLYYWIIISFGAVGWVWGYIEKDFTYTLYAWGVGVGISVLVRVTLPWLCHLSISHSPPLTHYCMATRSVSQIGHGSTGIQFRGKRRTVCCGVKRESIRTKQQRKKPRVRRRHERHDWPVACPADDDPHPNGGTYHCDDMQARKRLSLHC